MRTSRFQLSILGVAVFAAATAGCTTTIGLQPLGTAPTQAGIAPRATVQARPLRVVEGKILKSDAEDVYLGLDAGEFRVAYRSYAKTPPPSLQTPKQRPSRQAATNLELVEWYQSWDRWFAFNPHPYLSPVDPTAHGFAREGVPLRKYSYFKIKRSAVREVSHPGLGLGIAGTILAGAGLVGVVAGAIHAATDNCGGKDEYGDYVGSCAVGPGTTGLLVMIPSAVFGVLPGAAMMVPGWVMYAGSKERFQPPSKSASDKATRPRLLVAPVRTPGQNVGASSQVTGLRLGIGSRW